MDLDVANWLNKNRSAVGISVKLNSSDINLEITKLFLNKGIISHEVFDCQLATFKSLQDEQIKNLPVSLNIYGKAVLTKFLSVTKRGENKPDQLVKEAWPSVNPSDFCIQQYWNSSGVFLSIIRKDTLYSFLKLLGNHKLAIIDVKLGIFPLQYLLPFIESPIHFFEKDREKVVISDNEILEVASSNDVSGEISIQVGEEKVKSQWLPGYGAALNLLGFGNANIELLSEEVNELREEWTQKQRFFKSLSLTLITAFLLLLINFLIFSYFQEKNQDLENQAGKSLMQLQYLKSLQDKNNNQLSILKENGWMESTSSSFIFDRIAASVPPEVRLIELELNPIEKQKSKSEKKLIIDQGVLRVKGKCSNSLIINSWITKLSEFSWIKNIKSQRFNFDVEQGIGIFEFTIVINN